MKRCSGTSSKSWASWDCVIAAGIDKSCGFFDLIDRNAIVGDCIIYIIEGGTIERTMMFACTWSASIQR